MLAVGYIFIGTKMLDRRLRLIGNPRALQPNTINYFKDSAHPSTIKIVVSLFDVNISWALLVSLLIQNLNCIQLLSYEYYQILYVI